MPEPLPTAANSAAAAAQPAATAQPSITGDSHTQQLLAIVLESLDDDQAIETVAIPLEGKSSIADHIVIASGRSSRQVAAIAQKLAERLKKQMGIRARIEGLPVADWVLIDAGDVVVHIFRPEVRSFYNLERMWGFSDAPVAVSEA